MRPSENIEKLIEKLRYKTSDETHDRILDNVMKALDEKQKQKPGVTAPVLWRIIMKNTFTKLSTAATIITAAAILVAVLLNKSTPAAYAIEQTFEAMRNVTTAHCFGSTFSDERIEMWIKVNPETGDNEYFYVDTPDMTIVASPDNTYQYDKKQKKVIHLKGSYISSDVRFGRFIEDMVEKTKSNPNANIKIRDIEGEKPAILLIIETDKLFLESRVDPTTKLPMSMNFKPKGKPQPGMIGQSIDEIYYNEPLPKGIFEFVIPEGSQVIEH